MKYIFNAIAFTYIKLKLYYFAREEYQDVSSVLLVNGTNKLEEIFLKLNGITFIWIFHILKGVISDWKEM